MTTFSQELFDRICERIADGESLRAICRDDDMPSSRDVRRWLATMPDIVPHYTRAREEQADKIFDEILTIADSQEGDVIEVDGLPVTNHDAIARAKLRIDARKWMAGKLRPKVYGEKLDLTHGNPDGSPIQFQTIIEAKPK